MKVLVAVLSITASLSCQTTWFVDASAAPGGDGSSGAPFQSIQSGVNAAVTGDTVLVAPGTYVGSVTITAKDITLRSTQGPDVTLMGFINGCGMTITSTSPACVIEGLTITNCTGINYICGVSAATHGGMSIVNAGPIVRRCVIKNNSGGNAGHCSVSVNGPAGAGGIHISGNPFLPAVLLENCVIVGNQGGTGDSFFDLSGSGFSHDGETGGVNCTGRPVNLRHCTITNNHGGADGPKGSARPGRGGVAGLTTTNLINCIVWGNTPGPGSPSFPTPSAEEIGTSSILPLNPMATWCDIRGGYPGVGNFDANPAFVAPGSDYHLSTGSPCVDLGTVAGVFGDLEFVWRPQYLAPDVGAYEWRPPVALTLSITQPGGPSWAAIATSGGGAGDWYIQLFTADLENGGPYAGNGQWGGLWIPPEDVVFQVGVGAPPFVGTLDASGSALSGVALPPGLTGVVLYAVAHTIGGTLVNRRSAIVSYTLL